MSQQEYVLPSGVRVTRKGYDQWRKDEGLCRECNSPIHAPHSRRYCQHHMIANSNGAKGYRAKA